MVSRMAGPVIADYPCLMQYMPMFWDKGPVEWRQDSPARIARKVARQISSSSPAMALMEHTVPLLERSAPESKPLVLLYRWIASGYIYRGYREGLRARSMVNGTGR